MDLNRIRALAGLLTEGETHVTKTDIHVGKRPYNSGGVSGDMINIMDPKIGDPLAEMLGIPDGWKMVKVGSCYAAFKKGDQLCFFTDKHDHQEDLYD